VLWAALTGRRLFVALIGASREHADEMLDAIKAELETNELLAADFPEVCVPIWELEGIVNRCTGQLHNGKRTHIGWKGARIVLPTIEGSQASGAVICVRGITGRVRGMKFVRADGQTVRPDLAVIDDPQTDASAASPYQCAKRRKVITGAILGLAGPGKKIAGFMPCTIIHKGDLADELLDREKHPAWHGSTFHLVNRFPDDDKLWDEYAERRQKSLRNGGDGSEATAFYKKHRKAMDAGADVVWKDRFNPDELSAIQNAMNLRIDHPETFDSEYQNAPKVENPDAEIASSTAIAGRTSGLDRGAVPLAAAKLTAFIDVQHKLLYWVVCAWGDDFTGTVIDYGTWPDQERSYFALRDAKRTLQSSAKGRTAQEAVAAGLTALTSDLCRREWTREGGAPVRLDRILVDGKDGTMTEVVARVCRTSEFASLLIPSSGRGIGPNDKPMHQYSAKPGEKIGTGWILQRSARFAMRWVSIDTNWWKTLVHQRLACPTTDHGALTIFGRKGTDHRMIADHLTAESRSKIRNEKTGRTVDVWKLKPGQSENHWFDCVVGSAVAASLSGCDVLGGVARPTRKKPPREKVSPLQF
jgi:hypothetical protein